MAAKRFSKLLISTCAAAALAGMLAGTLTGASHAQRYGHPPAAGSDPTGFSQRANDNNAQRFEDGRQALASKNFQTAEAAFRDVLRHNPNHPEANFLMGVTQMSQTKWEDAKKYLEIAVRKNPKGPDPKSRLAVTYINLGDIASATRQREDLVKLGDACKGKCKNAEWIASGIAMIDAALPPAS